jgi:probable phosphoglycerate mutase
LTPVGLAQAKSMGRLIKGFTEVEGPWSVISSPLRRAVHTAEIIRDEVAPGCAVETDDRLVELDVGAFDGLTRDGILALEPRTQIAPGWIFLTPGGESEDQVTARLRAWLSSFDEADGRRRVVVSHGIAGRMLRQLYAGEPDHGRPPAQDSVFQLSEGRISNLGDLAKV